MSEDELPRFRDEKGLRLPDNQNPWTLESTDLTAAEVQEDMDRRNGTNKPRSRFERPDYRWASTQPVTAPTVNSAPSSSASTNSVPVNSPPAQIPAPVPATSTLPVDQEPPQPQGTTLEMVHSGHIIPPSAGSRYPGYNPCSHINYIPPGSRLYSYAGPVVRVMCEGVAFDVMACVRHLCTYCQSYKPYTHEQLKTGEIKGHDGQKNDANAAEGNPAIDLDGSPFKGLPFVHAGMDCTADKFEPMEPEMGVKTYDVPDQTRERWIILDDKGNRAGGMLGYRKALTCWPGCKFCAVEVSR